MPSCSISVSMRKVIWRTARCNGESICNAMLVDTTKSSYFKGNDDFVVSCDCRIRGLRRFAYSCSACSVKLTLTQACLPSPSAISINAALIVSISATLKDRSFTKKLISTSNCRPIVMTWTLWSACRSPAISWALVAKTSMPRSALGHRVVLSWHPTSWRLARQGREMRRRQP